MLSPSPVGSYPRISISPIWRGLARIVIEAASDDLKVSGWWSPGESAWCLYLKENNETS